MALVKKKKKSLQITLQLINTFHLCRASQDTFRVKYTCPADLPSVRTQHRGRCHISCFTHLHHRKAVAVGFLKTWCMSCNLTLPSFLFINCSAVSKSRKKSTPFQSVMWLLVRQSRVESSEFTSFFHNHLKRNKSDVANYHERYGDERAS